MPLRLLHDILTLPPRLVAELDGWSGWPFSGFGYEGGFWPVVARFIFIAVLLGAIALVLRLLFGPGGPLRGEGWETIQEANKRREAERLAAEQESRPRAPGEDEQNAPRDDSISRKD